ncbi:hypothetical protein V1520DRAFT_150980 [Lipomyces starkeyi]
MCYYRCVLWCMLLWNDYKYLLRLCVILCTSYVILCQCSFQQTRNQRPRDFLLYLYRLACLACVYVVVVIYDIYLGEILRSFVRLALYMMLYSMYFDNCLLEIGLLLLYRTSFDLLPNDAVVL